MTITTTSTAHPSSAVPGTGPRAFATVATALAPAAWGTTYLVTTAFLPADHSLFAALMRALPAGLIGLLIARRLPRGQWWWKAAVLGTLNIGLFFPLLFIAAARLPGGVAATLGATQPILITILAVLVLGERLSRWRLAWGIVGIIGVGMVVLGPAAGFDMIGILAGIGGAAAMGTGVILTKRWGRPPGVSAVGVAGWQLSAGGFVLLIPTLVFEGIPESIDTAGVLGYLWLGIVGGLLAYTLWFRGLGRLPVTATALLGLLSPLVAAGLGVAFAGESLNLIQIAGFTLALAALFCGQLNPHSLVGPRARTPKGTTS
ncbi:MULTISPECIES: EamA family transporter [unclassified Brevibacterium]|uniref:EamA family transporter n=1 Tax=unclassified Brevibacterium TaxID=2614124 RepID=UPI001E58A459|nr:MULTISPECIES: EamA family transporter [unclassified Brevibacterium]MCD1285491.1 EamA family transporter [Brevibacterium sp. CCUG 69071]MDK8434543.1 EamA family transporter [Brevibacterium sp. H-BE7]